MRKLALAGVIGLMLAAGGLGLAGCGGNPNENETRNAPPGKPSEFPNESVAERKARTKAESRPAKNSKGSTSHAAPK